MEIVTKRTFCIETRFLPLFELSIIVNVVTKDLKERCLLVWVKASGKICKVSRSFKQWDRLA